MWNGLCLILLFIHMHHFLVMCVNMGQEMIFGPLQKMRGDILYPSHRFFVLSLIC
jgi:hypothetical protein